MSRATLFYLATCAILVLGMWTVLHIGAGLHAPPDLRGRWALTSPAGAWPDPGSFSVAQSGLFLDVSWGAQVYSGSLSDGGAKSSSPLTAELTTRDGDRRMSLSIHRAASPTAGTTLSGQIDGNAGGTFVAIRDVPTSAATPAH